MPPKRESKKVEKVETKVIVEEVVETGITLDNIINPNNTEIKETTKTKKISIKKKATTPEIKSEDDNDNTVINTPEPKPEKVKPIRGMKKIKKGDDLTYLRLPEKNSIIVYNDIKVDKVINEKIKILHTKIKCMHQILWEYEKMDGPKALDEIMKLLFIRCIETLISDNKVDNKIDLFNPDYHKNILSDGDDDDRENFEIAKSFLKDFKSIHKYLEDAFKKGEEDKAMLTLYNPDANKCDIFKSITKILSNHSTTKGIYTETNMFNLKDAHTLKLLLKHMNAPCFDNIKEIEDLIGEIYEYFLNNYNKKKSALGQLFTPRMLMHIAIMYLYDRLLKIFKTVKTPIVSDKCMGTGGWLVKMFNEFKSINNNILLHGKEHDPDTYRYGLINLISTTGNYPFEPAVGDSLTNIEDNIKINVASSNPPFKGKFEYNKLRTDYNKNRRKGFNTPKFEDIYFLEEENSTPLQFLQMYIHTLAIGGICMIVVPYGELFSKDGKSMIEVRKKLLNIIDLTDIIICPPGIFTHTDVKVCMLILEKNIGGTKEVKFSRFEFDKTNTILQSISHITTVKRTDILKEPICSLYHMDYLHDEYSDNLQKEMPNYEWVEFGEVFELVKGQLQSSKVEEIEDGEYPVISKCQDINDWKKTNEYTSDGENIYIFLTSNTTKLGITYYNGKCMYTDLVNRCIININYKDKLNLKFIYYYIKFIKNMIENTYLKGSCQQSLDFKNISRMKIPIPPIEIQNTIISQMDSSYTKIPALENVVSIMKNTDIPMIFTFGWKAEIAEWIEFGDIIDLIKGQIQSSKVEEDESGDGVLINWSIYDNYKKINNPELDGENIFISTSMPNGKNGCSYLVVKYYNGKCSYCDILSRIIIKPNYINKINIKYLSYYLNSIKKHIEFIYEKGSCNKSLDIKNFYRMQIPIIPKDKQDNLMIQITEVEDIIKRWNEDIENIKNKDTQNLINFLSKEHKKKFDNDNSNINTLTHILGNE